MVTKPSSSTSYILFSDEWHGCEVILRLTKIQSVHNWLHIKSVWTFISSLVGCSFHEMLWCDRRQTFQKVQLFAPRHHQDVFWPMWDEPLCSLASSVFCLEFSHDAIFDHCWIMNSDFSWRKGGLQSFKCSSGFVCDLQDDLLMRS